MTINKEPRIELKLEGKEVETFKSLVKLVVDTNSKVGLYRLGLSEDEDKLLKDLNNKVND